MWRIAIIGATLSGNKGAAAMLQSVLDNLPPRLGSCQFSVLSVYPAEDRALNRDKRVDIVPAKPVALVMAVPLAAVWAALNRLHLPLGPLYRNQLLSSIDKCDMLIDLSGISFSDGRLIELIYNVACVLPSLLMGERVIKYSQAMGPFRTVLNRTLAKIILPRITLNIARGRKTLTFLEELGLENTDSCADAAFSLTEEQTEETYGALQALELFGQRRIVGVSVSSVMDSYCRRRGLDYPQIMASFIDRAIEDGYSICLIAHAVKSSKQGGRTDDAQACQAVYRLVSDKQNCHLIVENYSHATLRAIIGRCSFLVSSRFHAMVSGLVERVPTMVTSWSHKYAEVLEMFEVEEWMIGHQNLSADAVWLMFQELVGNEADVKAHLARHLPNVIASSQRNAELTASLLTSTKR